MDNPSGTGDPDPGIEEIVRDPASHSYLGSGMREVRPRQNRKRHAPSSPGSCSNEMMMTWGSDMVRDRLDRVYDLIMIALPDIVLFPGQRQAMIQTIIFIIICCNM